MRNKYLLPISLFVIVVLLFASKVFADTLDQSNTSGTIGIGFGDLGNGRDYMCQGFKMATYNQITAISFYVKSKDGNANVGYKVWIDNANANSEPTGTVAVGIGGGTEITNATLNTTTLTKYTLGSTVDVTIGNQYTLCLAPWNTSTHVWASSYNDFQSSVSNPYANGRRTHGDTAYTTWSAPDSGNADIHFEIYGQTAAAAGGGTSVKLPDIILFE